MFATKVITALTFILLTFGYTPLASACQDKFNYFAYGYLEKADLDQLKQRFRNNSLRMTRENKLTLWDVSSILGFSGEQISSKNNGRVETWIWLDRENCRRYIKANFKDRELSEFQSYGF